MKLERAEWGNDLPSVELQLETQQHIHTSVEELGSSVKEARLYEVRGRVHDGEWAGQGGNLTLRSAAVPKEKGALGKSDNREQHLTTHSLFTEMLCSLE